MKIIGTICVLDNNNWLTYAPPRPLVYSQSPKKQKEKKKRVQRGLLLLNPGVGKRSRSLLCPLLSFPRVACRSTVLRPRLIFNAQTISLSLFLDLTSQATSPTRLAPSLSCSKLFVVCGALGGSGIEDGPTVTFHLPIVNFFLKKNKDLSIVINILILKLNFRVTV